jgi:hypothetical protein
VVETAHESLHAQLAEHGEDVALWGVYGDLLQSESNVHGPLVTLMLERERVPSRAMPSSTTIWTTTSSTTTSSIPSR